MINYGKHYIDKDDIKNVVKVLKSNHLTQGPTIKLFEAKLNEFFGSKYCTVVSSGTAALHIAGVSLGWDENSTIITTPLTFVATANAVEFSRSKLELADIKSDGTIDPTSVEKIINRYKLKKKKITAVIGVDYYGNTCDWEALNKLRKKNKFKLINDNCHALGSIYKKTDKYAIKYADIVTQSFHPVKNITTGEGGCLITNNLGLKKKFDILRTHGIVKKKNSFASLSSEMKYLGFNYRITDFSCALGISQLKKIKKFIKKRRLIAKIYDDFFSEYQNYFSIPEKNDLCNPSYHLYPLRIKFKKLKTDKKKFFQILKKNFNLNLQVHYNPIYNHPYYKKKYKLKKKNYPNTENFFQEVVSLPIFFSLSKEDVVKISNIILKICLREKF